MLSIFLRISYVLDCLDISYPIKCPLVQQKMINSIHCCTGPYSLILVVVLVVDIVVYYGITFAPIDIGLPKAPLTVDVNYCKYFE